MPNAEHICLLPDAEITNLYARPDFNEVEQQLYFTLNEHERVLSNQYTNVKTRVYFILQLGYFKAKHQFFKFTLQEVAADVTYILAHFFNRTQVNLTGQLSRDYHRQQKHDILSLFDYKENAGTQNRLQIESHIAELLRYYPKSHNAAGCAFCIL